MAHRLIALMGLLSLFGCGGDRLVQRSLGDVAVIDIPASAKTVGEGLANDEDPSRLSYRFAREYGLASIGSGTAYRQLLVVSVLAPDAASIEYERWPARFQPLYSRLSPERTQVLDVGQVAISSGRYAQNALDEPAHVYVFADPARRLQIAWHVVDADVASADALELVRRMAASFELRTDPGEHFAEMRGREFREQERITAAVDLARETLVNAGFGAAAPGQPAFSRGVYVEWMEEPEPRLQLLKPLGLIRLSGLPPLPRPQAFRGSIGWHARVDGTGVSDNRDNAYLPLPGIQAALDERHTDASTALYYTVTTLRVESAEASAIASLGGFFEELPAVERAWAAGAIVDGERLPTPELAMENSDDCDRTCFGIDLATGSPPLDALRRRLARAARGALPDVRAGRFDAADAQVLAVDRDIQSAVMLGAMYTAALREAVTKGERDSRTAFVAALHERALHWRLSAYPEPHTAYEADSNAAGRDADRAQLAALRGPMR